MSWNWRLWLHRKGVHFYNVPVGIVEQEDWRIEGKGDVKSQVKQSLYRKERCQFCNRRQLKHLKSCVTTRGSGSWWT